MLEYAVLQACEQVLLRLGFRKNHFAHYARAGDDNLYYRHAVRGEDLLALGPTADGAFGPYHYRHGEWDEYRGGQAPALSGGMEEGPLDRRLHGVWAAMLAGPVPADMLAELGCESLLAGWQSECLIHPVAPGRFDLTANGSWCLADMLAELEWRAT